MGEHYDHTLEANLEMLGGSSGHKACHGGGGHGAAAGGAYVQWNAAQDYVFFQWWTATTPFSFWMTVFLLFVIALLYEVLAYFRAFFELSIFDKLAVRRNSSSGSPDENNDLGSVSGGHHYEEEAQVLRSSQKPQLSERPPIFFEGRLPWKAPQWMTNVVVQINLALLYGFQVFIAYFLMMVFMTFNGFFIIAILTGFTCGKFITLHFKQRQLQLFANGTGGLTGIRRPSQPNHHFASTYETPCH